MSALFYGAIVCLVVAGVLFFMSTFVCYLADEEDFSPRERGCRLLNSIRNAGVLMFHLFSAEDKNASRRVKIAETLSTFSLSSVFLAFILLALLLIAATLPN
jgi:hypothetical protein